MEHNAERLNDLRRLQTVFYMKIVHYSASGSYYVIFIHLFELMFQLVGE